MDKNNYLSRGEQGLWRFIEDKGIVDTELVRAIFPDMADNKRNKLLHSLCTKGYLKRSRKGLYYNPNKIESFYELALRISEGYIGLSSALRFHRLLDYEDFTIFVMTQSFQKKFDLKGTQYTAEFIPLHNLFTGYEKHERMYVSSVEKTLFDCLLKPGYVGYANITKAFYSADIDWLKFIDFFKLTENRILHQRTGYILELTKKYTKKNIPNFAFGYLLKKVDKPAKLAAVRAKSVFNSKWKIQDNLGEKNILSWWYDGS